MFAPTIRIFVYSGRIVSLVQTTDEVVLAVLLTDINVRLIIMKVQPVDIKWALHLVRVGGSVPA